MHAIARLLEVEAGKIQPAALSAAVKRKLDATLEELPASYRDPILQKTMLSANEASLSIFSRLCAFTFPGRVCMIG